MVFVKKNLKIEYKTYNCRESDFMLLKTKSCKTKYGIQTFDYVAATLWNALPIHIRTQENVDEFKKIVKRILFEETEGFKRRAFLYD